MSTETAEAANATVSQHKLRKNYLHMESPTDLKVDWRKNLSRGGVEPAVDEALISLAKDMMPCRGDGDSEDGSSGQLNPILVRVLPSGEREVIGGFRRMRAAMYLIESELCPDFKIKYVIETMSDAEAALKNLSENLQREEPSPIQLAHAVRALTESYGMTMQAIAGRLKRSIGYLNGLLELLTLPKEIRTSVADGEMPIGAALELAKLPPGVQIETFNELASDGKKVSVKAVKEKLRERHESTGEGKAVKRTCQDLLGWLECQTGPADPGNKVAVMLLDWLEGKLSTAKLEKGWEKLLKDIV